MLQPWLGSRVGVTAMVRVEGWCYSRNKPNHSCNTNP